jgi:hypothetical protein
MRISDITAGREMFLFFEGMHFLQAPCCLQKCRGEQRNTFLAHQVMGYIQKEANFALSWFYSQ